MKNIVVNGVGTIGKRVAHAIKKQEDMDLIGLADVSPTPNLRTVLSEGGPLHKTPLYTSVPDKKSNLEKAGFEVRGSLPDLLDTGEVDLVVDATPGGIEEKNKPLYEKHNTKAIFEGGADSEIANKSFSSLANYGECKGEDYLRVISCNTTSLARTLSTVNKDFKIKKAVASLIRRGGDPNQDSRGPIDSIIPVDHVPSHHGPDVNEVLPGIDITTLAVKVSTTMSHVHTVTLELDEELERETIINKFEDEARINLLEAEKGFNSTAKVLEKYRELRLRHDMPEVGVWKETVKVEENKLYWIHMVHQESIVIPENIDAIRAALEMAEKENSIKKTNNSLELV